MWPDELWSSLQTNSLNSNVSDDDVDIEDTDTWREDHNGGNNLDDTFQFIMDTDIIEEASEDEYTDGDSDEEDVYLAYLE